MASVTLELEPEVLAALRLDPEGFVRAMRVAAAIYWYQCGDISQHAAAQLAGMSRLEFMELLASRKLDVFVVDFDDLGRELARG
ncbi:MAG: UPF0175 family protein [Armatimonadetes bacterium]|nr:UPF0175 family protein [Armatimonadota bacterium]